MNRALPVIDGVGPGTVLLPAGCWPTILDFLVERFPDIPEKAWRSRMARGRVLDREGLPIDSSTAFTAGVPIHYYRELEDEPEVPFEADILHLDAQLLIADKPHFLPVIPSGRWLQQSLLVRLKKATGLDDLVPLHRIDRGTAGLVAFSVDPVTRGRYQSLFPQRAVTKTYEALAPVLPLPQRSFPFTHRSRLVAAEPFFRMQEASGAPNSETRIDLIEELGELAHYRLEPLTGRKHQLRVHMAAIGAPIVNDDFYPQVQAEAPAGMLQDYSRPLKLLARALAFTDPLSGEPRRFESRRRL